MKSLLVLQSPDWSVENDSTLLGDPGLFYKYFSAQCWPGPSVWIDFLNSEG